MKNIVTENPEFSIITMARINATNLSSIDDSEELIDFIAVNRYEPENSDLLETDDFTKLPDHVRSLIYILDFETEYEMEGIHTLLENSLGSHLDDIIMSFEKSGNAAIASFLREIRETKDSQKIDEIDSRLQPVILEKDFWDNVRSYIKSETKNHE